MEVSVFCPAIYSEMIHLSHPANESDTWLIYRLLSLYFHMIHSDDFHMIHCDDLLQLSARLMSLSAAVGGALTASGAVTQSRIVLEMRTRKIAVMSLIFLSFYIQFLYFFLFYFFRVFHFCIYFVVVIVGVVVFGWNKKRVLTTSVISRGRLMKCGKD